jgi:hypothetical protein
MSSGYEDQFHKLVIEWGQEKSEGLRWASCPYGEAIAGLGASLALWRARQMGDLERTRLLQGASPSYSPNLRK